MYHSNKSSLRKEKYWAHSLFISNAFLKKKEKENFAGSAVKVCSLLYSCTALFSLLVFFSFVLIH